MGQFKRDLEKKDVELDRRVYHLKTLNDVSKDIFSSVDSKSIIRNFLLMSMGTFGVLQGFIITTIAADQEIEHFNEVGFKPEDLSALKSNAIEQLRLYRKQEPAEPGAAFINPERIAPHGACALPFQISDDCFGLVVLGSKLIGEPYSDDDNELMGTLLNSLVVSLKNARSFEKVKRLNLDLQNKNIELEKMLKKLQAALMKVEILESIKSNLT